ncbi:hypothetical protein SS50377_24854 [Spironucleus salmonicida]|uniref:Uncharacterized protein n=1 Tax=Spironucleus salmonicida TaxID=348837 RepID=V6LWZ9_9EUKA|nr:hypothetical protein SS50377_24854 [Spironucleus salmonicida]|eukprot:EST49115.1 Hypothetical protein SS50377_10600 [Spironucleus salmonicida]
MHLKPHQLNFFSQFEGKFFVYSNNKGYEISRELEVLQTFTINVTLPETNQSNIYQTHNNQAIINKNIYEFNGKDIIFLKSLNLESFPTISKKQQFVCKGILYNINKQVAAHLTFIPNQDHKLYFFNSMYAIDTEEETAFFDENFINNQENDSQIKGILLTYKNYIIDDMYSYFDIKSGSIVYPISHFIDLIKYQFINDQGDLDLKPEIVDEYENYDYLDEPVTNMFGFQKLKISNKLDQQ